MTTSQVPRAADFVWLTGRALDQRRMEYFTGAADARGVILALEGYSTEDGGYAYGLEPDVKGPLAQPLTVMTALRVLDEVDALDAGRVERLIRWLGGQVAPDGGIPPLLATIRDYPRPPWIAPPDRPGGGLLPTARIAGLLHKHRITAPWLDAATAFCWNALETMKSTHPYEVHSSVVFLDHVPDRDRAVRAAARLGELVREQELFLADPDHPERGRVAPGYAESEFHYAPDFATAPDSLAARWFTEAELTAGLDHLVAGQETDGGWQINWRRWAPTTESAARPGATIENLRILRAWNRLAG